MSKSIKHPHRLINSPSAAKHPLRSEFQQQEFDRGLADGAAWIWGPSKLEQLDMLDMAWIVRSYPGKQNQPWVEFCTAVGIDGQSAGYRSGFVEGAYREWNRYLRDAVNGVAN